MRDRFLPGDGVPARTDGGDVSKAPVHRLRAAGAVFVASIIELNMLTIGVQGVTGGGALPAAVRTHIHDRGDQKKTGKKVHCR